MSYCLNNHVGGTACCPASQDALSSGLCRSFLYGGAAKASLKGRTARISRVPPSALRLFPEEIRKARLITGLFFFLVFTRIEFEVPQVQH